MSGTIVELVLDAAQKMLYDKLVTIGMPSDYSDEYVWQELATYAVAGDAIARMRESYYEDEHDSAWVRIIAEACDAGISVDKLGEYLADTVVTAFDSREDTDDMEFAKNDYVDTLGGLIDEMR